MPHSSVPSQATAFADGAEPIVWQFPMPIRFRGITRREGMLLPGPAGWSEWSPFWDYSGAELEAWLRAADEARNFPYPEPVRTTIPVNATVPAVSADVAYAIAADSGCRTVKIKVAESGQRPGDDVDRIAAVRAALGPSGKIRIDANGAWSVDEAFEAIGRFARFDLEYAEQPCARVNELAELRTRLARSRIEVAIAADESIRRTGDPERVAELDAADIAVLKVQPLGGVRACLDLAERLGLPVVVSSAVESSIGLAAGLALAAALPRLPYACGLNTASLLAGDLVADPPRVQDGQIALCPRPQPSADLVAAARADVATTRSWQQRLAETRQSMRLEVGR